MMMMNHDWCCARSHPTASMRRRRRCAFIGFLLPTLINCQLCVIGSIVFLEKASSFSFCVRCHRHSNTRISTTGTSSSSSSSTSTASPWQHPTTLLRSTMGQPDTAATATTTTSTSTSTAATTTKSTFQTLSLVESIIPAGFPMQQHGTPVGAVILPGPCIETFSKECQAVFPELKNLRFRGVETKHYDYDYCKPTTTTTTTTTISSRKAAAAATTTTNAEDDGGAATDGTVDATVALASYKAIHLQTEVAASLVDGDAPSLVDFISRNGGSFLPGVRMKRKITKTKTKSTTNAKSTTKVTTQQQKQRRINQHSSNDEQLHVLLDENGNETISSSTTRTTTAAAARSSKFTFVELFAGVGGFRLDLEPLGGSCVLASEKDAMACAFYRRHFHSDLMMILPLSMAIAIVPSSSRETFSTLSLPTFHPPIRKAALRIAALIY